jgi:hypothetical protein
MTKVMIELEFDSRKNNYEVNDAEVREDDKNGLLESEIFTYETRLGLHADDDRDEILYQIAEQRAWELGV